MTQVTQAQEALQRLAASIENRILGLQTGRAKDFNFTVTATPKGVDVTAKYTEKDIHARLAINDIYSKVEKSLGLMMPKRHNKQGEMYAHFQKPYPG